MRPKLLELSGFTAFREPVTVDFRGADLFALTGPTGSGKSSLIDAIVFALYGSVPRIGQRDVAPIVSLGKLEARVRFEFSLEGVDYSVARVVRRTKGGASTAEARLERAGEVLAGTAEETISSGSAGNGIVTRSGQDGVVSSAAADGVISAKPFDGVVSPATDDDILADRSRQHVAAMCAHQRGWLAQPSAGGCR